jgi:hypothetical protein
MQNRIHAQAEQGTHVPAGTCTYRDTGMGIQEYPTPGIGWWNKKVEQTISQNAPTVLTQEGSREMAPYQ